MRASTTIPLASFQYSAGIFDQAVGGKQALECFWKGSRDQPDSQALLPGESDRPDKAIPCDSLRLQHADADWDLASICGLLPCEGWLRGGCGHVASKDPRVSTILFAGLFASVFLNHSSIGEWCSDENKLTCFIFRMGFGWSVILEAQLQTGSVYVWTKTSRTKWSTVNRYNKSIMFSAGNALQLV